MTIFFFDSSALVKRYVTETGTAWVQSLFAPSAGNKNYIAEITGPELVSAITRRLKRGNTPPANATAALTVIRADFVQEYSLIEISADVIARAMDLAERYGLRGYDAVQLSAALFLRDQCRVANVPDPVLIAADAELNSAALSEGLRVDDPNNH